MSAASFLVWIASPGVIVVLCVLGFCVWMLLRPHAAEPPRLLLVLLAFAAFGPISDAYMNALSHNLPLKFDYFLHLIDRSLGVTAFSVARLFSEWIQAILFNIYQSLVWVMMIWYWVILKSRSGRPNRLLIAYVVNFVVGACLYPIVPGCGPRHAFGAAFPTGNPDVSPVLVSLHGWPNAIPSLHVSTALLFLLFAGESRVRRGMACVFLAGTIGATLAFEHYVIDVIVAVPFACFAALAADGKIRMAVSNLALVLVWLLAIRFVTPTLVAYPIVLRTLALATIGLAVYSMKGRRTRVSRKILQPLPMDFRCPASVGPDLAQVVEEQTK